MDLLDISLIFSITLCSLVSGFIFTYAIVVMPGLSNLNDKELLRAFQVADAFKHQLPVTLPFPDPIYE